MSNESADIDVLITKLVLEVQDVLGRDASLLLVWGAGLISATLNQDDLNVIRIQHRIFFHYASLLPLTPQQLIQFEDYYQRYLDIQADKFDLMQLKTANTNPT